VNRSLIALRIASVMALIGLALMLWGVLVPTPMPVILAMSLGQGIGTLSFLIYLVVVVADLRRAHVFDVGDEKDPP
jgi:hypothetical protein